MYTIYTQAGRKCPHCERAAGYLDAANIPYKLRPLALDDLLVVAAKANMNTVPIIYHGDTLIGGADQLQEAIAQ